MNLEKKAEVSYSIRLMEKSDYDRVRKLWMSIHGFGIRSLDDSREYVCRFIERNPSTSIVAETEDGEIIGAILCGHDGRTACFYHVCVREEYRRHGIGNEMVATAMRALHREHVSKVSLFAFTDNREGNLFWQAEGWKKREDVNVYDFLLDEKNITRFNS